MYKLLVLILFLFNSSLFGCAMCAIEIPNVDVKTTIYAKKNITTFDIEWQFEKEFNKALKPYDVNENGEFERPEREAILESIIDYIKPIHYLTNLEYNKKDTYFIDLFEEPIKTNFERLTFNQDGAMLFNYNFELDFTLQKDHKLAISFSDGGGNFQFKIKDVVLKDYDEFQAIVPKEQISYIYFFKEYNTQHELTVETKKIPDILKLKNNPNQKNEQTKSIESKQEINQEFDILELLSAQLDRLKKKIEIHLEDINENHSLTAYFWLLLFSFLYGILHAIGPGHGKTLVASYFVHQNRSYMKAFGISSMIAVVHTFSAFIITLMIYHILGMIFSSSMLDIEKMATKVSALIIIGIALYLIYKKISQNKTKYSFSVTTSPSFVKTAPLTHKPVESCGCSGCKTTSTDIGVILSAGIVPCPGTVTIFLFTISLGIYFIGFMSAIFMSMGMSLVIFITALLSIKLRKSSSSNKTLIKLFEYGSLGVILFLGILLLVI